MAGLEFLDYLLPETITQMPMPVQQQMITQMPQRPEMITQMPQKMEAITGLPQPVIIQPVAAQGALLDLTAQPDGKVKIGFQKKIGHGDNYEWITGQLSYMHVDGGVWVVRYAGLEEEDRFGGSVVLAPAVSMKNFREGDLVRVHGEVLDQGHSSHHLGGPLYRVNSVQILERSN